ncbi:hypothetical protein HPP92_018413 [Vanilla planifolia]|uniref:RNase H type-1 domain-containing protein n=1 Tax=Vanilla planifolia TaxID=51239 RepID=A0A835QDH5_VANPL|nr:hypothetical protein HPP92_018413 [Vanilla planifolia]
MCAYMLHAIWTNRNCKVHGEGVNSARNVARLIMHATSLVQPLDQRCHANPMGLDLISSSSWSPPPKGWIKINCDAAWKKDDSAAVGIIFRDEDGRPVKVIGNFIHVSNSFAAEYFAAIKALQIAHQWLQGKLAIWLESDSLQTVISLLHPHRPLKRPNGRGLAELMKTFRHFASHIAGEKQMQLLTGWQILLFLSIHILYGTGVCPSPWFLKTFCFLILCMSPLRECNL